MVGEELERTEKIISEAECPEDVFGLSPDIGSIKKVYRQLARILHPDHYENNPGHKEIADKAMKKLNILYGEAEKKLENNVYGDCKKVADADSAQSDFIIKTRKAEYHIHSVIAQGDLSTVYGGYFDENGKNNEVAVKLIDNPDDNDLAQNEIRALKIFQPKEFDQKKHLPALLDQFKTSEGQIGSVFQRIDGCDFHSIRENAKYKNGVPQKHMVWMLNRLLSVLGYSHSKGVIHGNIEPAHLMVRPKDHNLWLIDWSYAALNPASSGDGFKVFTENFSAPEVKQKKPPIPASDLYSAGKCMIYILGGDVTTNKMPAEVDIRLQRFILFFVRESPLQRAQDAWEMHSQLIKLIEELWGPRKFLEFEM